MNKQIFFKHSLKCNISDTYKVFLFSINFKMQNDEMLNNSNDEILKDLDI